MFIIIWFLCRIMFGNPKSNYGSLNYEYELNEHVNEKIHENHDYKNLNNDESVREINKIGVKKINSEDRFDLNLPGK